MCVCVTFPFLFCAAVLLFRTHANNGLNVCLCTLWTLMGWVVGLGGGPDNVYDRLFTIEYRIQAQSIDKLQHTFIHSRVCKCCVGTDRVTKKN